MELVRRHDATQHGLHLAVQQWQGPTEPFDDLSVTGDDRCFNTIRTCQDRVNFANDPVTLRFAQLKRILGMDSRRHGFHAR